MPKLADLYGVDLNRLGKYRPEYTSVMETAPTDFEMEQRKAPTDQEYASGRLEAPMFSPDDLIGSGVFTKLASLALPAAMAGIVKNKGGAWGTYIPDHLLKNSLWPPGYDQKSAPVWTRLAAPIAPIQGSTTFARKLFEGKTPEELLLINAGIYGNNHPNLARLRYSVDGTPESMDYLKRYAAVGMANRHLSDPPLYPEVAQSPDVAWKKWQRGPLVNYIRNRMATEDDPIRRLAEQGITHLAVTPDKLPRLSKYAKEARLAGGFPEKGVAKTQLGKLWENIADTSIGLGNPNKYGEIPYLFIDAHGLRSLPENQLDEISSFVREGLDEGRINPGAALRGNYSVESAVRDMHAARLVKEDVYKNATAFKEYPSGHKWVRLDKKGQFATESDNMGHSVRGYEAINNYGHGGWEGIQSGKAEVYSLRGENGKPVVTIEIDNSNPESPIITQVKGKFNKTSLPEDIENMVQDFAKTRGATIASR